MLATLYKTVLTATATSEVTEVADDGEVLPHCPYHNQIITYKAAREAFLETEGLVDFQEYQTRHAVLASIKAVGIEEVIYREDHYMLWTGITRLFDVSIEYIHLFKQIYHSNNWAVELEHLKKLATPETAMRAWTTYSTVKSLYEQEMFEAAGRALVDGFFTTPEPKNGNVDWPEVEPVSEGQKIAGLVSGMIYTWTGEENTDNLAGCIADSNGQLLSSFEDSFETLYGRWNADVLDSLAHTKATVEGMGSFVTGCSKQTQAQVSQLEEKMQALELNEDLILENLAMQKNHVELGLAKMKMQTAVHDFYELGTTYGDLVNTLTDGVCC